MRPADAPERLDDGAFEIDLGEGVWAQRTITSGDLPYGLITTHRCTNSPTGWRQGSLAFDLPHNSGASTKWQGHFDDPITLSPSIQHNCGCPLSHGYIRDGKWVRG